MKLIDTRRAVGRVLCHDMTQIIPGVSKDARFRKGHIAAEEDIPVLLSMGKEHLYVWEKQPGMLHEDEAALRLLRLCQNEHMHPTAVKEGKIELIADCPGLFRVDAARLEALNGEDQIMIATRHTNTAVQPGGQAGGNAHHPPGHPGGEAGRPGRHRGGDSHFVPHPLQAENLRAHHHRGRGGGGPHPGLLHPGD